MIYFTRYHPNESVTMLNLCYDELTRKIKNFEEKNTCSLIIIREIKY